MFLLSTFCTNVPSFFLVKHAWDYPWSSAAFHMGLKNSDPLVKDRTLMGLVDNWKDHLSWTSEEKDEEIRQVTRTGRPAGGESFVKLVEQKTGRDLSMGRPGRPLKKR
jgi:putative transposase